MTRITYQDIVNAVTRWYKETGRHADVDIIARALSVSDRTVRRRLARRTFPGLHQGRTGQLHYQGARRTIEYWPTDRQIISHGVRRAPGLTPVQRLTLTDLLSVHRQGCRLFVYADGRRLKTLRSLVRRGLVRSQYGAWWALTPQGTCAALAEQSQGAA